MFASMELRLYFDDYGVVHRAHPAHDRERLTRYASACDRDLMLDAPNEAVSKPVTCLRCANWDPRS